MHSICIAAPVATFARRACIAILASAFPLAASAQSTPFSGTPINVPAIIEAENFDRGGEGVGYHDRAGNTGGKYRTSESVDIIDSCDPALCRFVATMSRTEISPSTTRTEPAMDRLPE